jgi:hypothetical protein
MANKRRRESIKSAVPDEARIENWSRSTLNLTRTSMCPPSWHVDTRWPVSPQPPAHGVPQTTARTTLLGLG